MCHTSSCLLLLSLPVVLVLQFDPNAAWAVGGTDAAETAAARPAISPTQARDDALEAFEEGKRLYREGRYAQAADVISKAYALYPEPILLYNLARCYEQSGQLHSALKTYRKYLLEAGEVADREAVEHRIVVLSRQLEARRPDSARAGRPLAQRSSRIPTSQASSSGVCGAMPNRSRISST